MKIAMITICCIFTIIPTTFAEVTKLGQIISQVEIVKEISNYDLLSDRYDPKIISHLKTLISNTIAPETKDPKSWFLTGFNKFVTDFQKHISGKEYVSFQDYQNFLKQQRSYCGEIPCSVPPCCGDECDPCSTK